MVHHLNRKAIADSLLKVLTIDASELVSDISLEYESEVKYDILEKILDSFDLKDEERSLNICELFVEGMTTAINSRKFVTLIMRNKNLMKKMQSLCMSSINSEVGKELLKMMSKLTEAVLKEIKLKLKENAGVVEGKIVINFKKIKISVWILRTTHRVSLSLLSSLIIPLI